MYHKSFLFSTTCVQKIILFSSISFLLLNGVNRNSFFIFLNFFQKKVLTFLWMWCIIIKQSRESGWQIRNAGVAELADAQASGACGRKIVWVQVPSPALFFCFSGKPLEYSQTICYIIEKEQSSTRDWPFTYWKW